MAAVTPSQMATELAAATPSGAERTLRLVFLPDRREFLLWGKSDGRSAIVQALAGGAPCKVPVVVPHGRVKHVSGVSLPLLETVSRLASIPKRDLASLPPSISAWSVASKFALDLAVRERLVPVVVQKGHELLARWAAAISSEDDTARFSAIARYMPLAGYASPVQANGPAGPALRAFLDAAVDELVRAACAEAGDFGVTARAGAARAGRPAFAQRWTTALTGPRPLLEAGSYTTRRLTEALSRWSEPVVRGPQDRPRACFRLDLPEGDSDQFTLRFFLQSTDDPSLMVEAAEVWRTKERTLHRLGHAFRDPQEALLEALGQAAALFPPVGASLAQARPEYIGLDALGAWEFICEGGPSLSQAGFGVIVPAAITAAGQRRLNMRMRVGGDTEVAGAVDGTGGLSLDKLLNFRWEAAIGDQAITRQERAAIAAQKAPLVQHRGEWVAVDPQALAEIQQRLAAGTGRISGIDAIRAAFSGEIEAGGITASVVAEGQFARAMDKLGRGVTEALELPRTLQASLRPYQERGYAWLCTMGSLGLGACLADDMGLGKTVQALAFFLHQLETNPHDARPALVIAPTSVVGNWEREVSRFAPALNVVRHYGTARDGDGLAALAGPGTLVVTSYGHLRRDIAELSSVSWSTVVLDEAQNIKNAASATARAARRLQASCRFALTGTPVENRLAELWSILDFANPGLLGPLEKFRREYAVPVERYGDDRAAERLRRIVGPFLLRRLKSDPAVIQDLPPKNEMKVVCTLTREQATLYRAVVDEEMRRIEDAEGIERRGRVLALLMALKQVCNHPAQYLGEAGPLPRRSGKLERLTEMLEEALAAGDRALIFTQFREMGDRLVGHLEAQLGARVAFLHGGTPQKARDKLVANFQEDETAARIFVLSLKAGGTGLNLTAANHVFHYDRWWNPAVEDQATDRAYRIGQKRTVHVHKLLCAGTVEEKIDALLEKKRGLASQVIGSGERWITELEDDDLRELFMLSRDAVVAGDDTDDAEAAQKPKGGRRKLGRPVETEAPV